MKMQYYFLSVCLSFAAFMSSETFAQSKNLICADWHSKVDFNRPLVLVNSEIESQQEIIFAVGCLLQLEGNEEESNVSGASNGRVSKFLGQRVLKSRRCSYLFYQK